MLASTILLASSVGSTPTKVAVTPWCDNSMRVRISPASLPPAAAARAAELAASLKKKGMTDLAGAIYEEGTCASSSSSHPIAAPKGSRTEHGNLAASVQSDGSIAFSRVDTRDVLFTAVATFTLNAPPAVAADDDDASHGWTTLSDKMGTPSCSGGEFDGSLGSAESPAECLALIVASPLLPRINYGVWNPSNKGCYVCDLSDRGDSSTWTYKDVKGAASFVGPKLAPPGLGFYSANLTLTAGPAATDEIIYGLGQGNWTDEGGCPAPGLAGSRIVPLERNGQTVNLQQRKFHVSIPFTYSTAGYGFLFNMPGHGDVTIGAHGVGGSKWSQRAALYLDFWVSALPKSVAAKGASPTAIYTQYADATGHSPPLREDAMVFWQSRNRYKSSAIALSIAQRYDALGLDVGVLVIDYKNQLHDGDFAPNPACFPSVKALADGVHAAKIPTLMFSFWPEVKAASAEYTLLSQAGCLINPDLDGLAFDATIPECRALVWDKMLKPRYYDQGVNAYWLDETDGEGTGGGGDGDYGYNTSYGDALAYSNLWVNDWLSMYSDPVAKLNEHLPLVLTRGTWAGGQRHGIVLWSSDIHSSFEQLASQVPQGVHASMSGIPWWYVLCLVPVLAQTLIDLLSSHPPSSWLTVFLPSFPSFLPHF
jgi:alpha-D-xyloside xylohydrolase